jgi:magnesium transporter
LSKKKKDRQRKHGLPPGTLVFTGHQHVEAPEVTLVQFNEHSCIEKKTQESIPEPETEPEGLITWYDIRGLHQVPLIEQLGAQFNVHPLALEDVLDIQQRPKFEDYEDAFFVTLQALIFDESSREILTEQIAIYAGPGFVLSFQEKPDDTFQSVRNRLLHTNSRMRKKGVDYLVYSLMDVVVDHYYLVLDKLEVWIETQEHNVLENPADTDKKLIHKLKLQVIGLRKSILPLREAINAFIRSDNALVQDSTRIFLRDIYDHTIQIIDVLENWRDILNGLFELYLSQLSIRMNNVMQVLTIISTIFIPLTFIAGIYGMNFDNMPELHWENGYFIVWGLMLLLALILLAIFKRKQWL